MRKDVPVVHLVRKRQDAVCGCEAPQALAGRPSSKSGIYTLSPETSSLSKSRLVYNKACTSGSVSLKTSGRMSWQMKYSYQPNDKSYFTIVAAGKADGAKCKPYLGCDAAKSEPSLFSKSSSGTKWTVRLVRPAPGPTPSPSPKPSPSPAPTPSPAPAPSPQPSPSPPPPTGSGTVIVAPARPTVVSGTSLMGVTAVLSIAANPAYARISAQCLPASSAVSCQPGGTWTTPAAINPSGTTQMTVTGLTAGTTYRCWAATLTPAVNGWDYACSPAAEPFPVLNPPTVGAQTGPAAAAGVAFTGGVIEVTPSLGSPANTGTSLGAGCVTANSGCPSPYASFTAGASGTPQGITSLAGTATTLVGGTAYDCYAAEAITASTTSFACSTKAIARSMLYPPTITQTSPGTTTKTVDVTVLAATGVGVANVAGASLGAACVAPTSPATACPTAANEYVLGSTVITVGNVGGFTSGSAMAGTTAYDCYVATIYQPGGGEPDIISCSALTVGTSSA